MFTHILQFRFIFVEVESTSIAIDNTSFYSEA